MSQKDDVYVICNVRVIYDENLILLGYTAQKIKGKKIINSNCFYSIKFQLVLTYLLVFNCDKVHFAHSTSDYNRLTFFPELIISNLNDIEVSGRFLDHTSLVN